MAILRLSYNTQINGNIFDAVNSLSSLLPEALLSNTENWFEILKGWNTLFVHLTNAEGETNVASYEQQTLLNWNKKEQAN